MNLLGVWRKGENVGTWIAEDQRSLWQQTQGKSTEVKQNGAGFIKSGISGMSKLIFVSGYLEFLLNHKISKNAVKSRFYDIVGQQYTCNAKSRYDLKLRHFKS